MSTGKILSSFIINHTSVDRNLSITAQFIKASNPPNGFLLVVKLALKQNLVVIDVPRIDGIHLNIVYDFHFIAPLLD